MATHEQIPITSADPGLDGAAVSVELTLPDDPRSAAKARRGVDSLEGHAHPETLAKTRLLITEMVATATGANASLEIDVRLVVEDGIVRGEVITGRAVASRPRGWALLLVRRIASRWGVNHGTVWFEVDDRPPPRVGQ